MGNRLQLKAFNQVLFYRGNVVTITNIKYNVIGINTFHFDGILEEEVSKGNLQKREVT